jgi:hypothetical protein
MSVSTAVSFIQAFGPLALAPMFPNLIEAFNSDLASVVQFTQVCILVLGFSNFVRYESRTTALHRSGRNRLALYRLKTGCPCK